MKVSRVAMAVAVACTSSASFAGENVVQPVQVGTETVRFHQGVATLDLEKSHGAVQVTPLPMDHGSLSFGVAVYNQGNTPANIDIDSFAVRTGSQDLPVFSKDQLESKAKNRAMWAQIALAAAGGLSAAAAASQRDHYHSTFITPHGTYRAVYSAPSVVGQVQATAIAAGTGAGIASIQNRLDETRAALGENIVQLTTVDPGESYAGQIGVAKIKDKVLPQRVSVVVHWNGEDYPFAFQLAKKGTAAPVFTALTPSMPSTPSMPAPAPASTDAIPSGTATIPVASPAPVATGATTPGNVAEAVPGVSAQTSHS